MIGEIGRNILRFISLLLIQGLVLNNINLGTYFNPYIYILFLIALPFETPKWALIPVGFGYGLLMDAFSNTLGLHAAACVLLMYVRPRMLRLFAPRDGYEFGMQPTIQSMGLNWFLYYAGMMILIHHTAFFLLEAFRFEGLFQTMLRIVSSSMVSLALMVLAQYLGFRPNR